MADFPYTSNTGKLKEFLSTIRTTGIPTNGATQGWFKQIGSNLAMTDQYFASFDLSILLTHPVKQQIFGNNTEQTTIKKY
jgi:hypothetical protein